LAPQRGDPEIFEREPFIKSVAGGFVQFNYHGWHQELLKQITPEDVGWASDWLGRLSEHQWCDAFQAGGYEPAIADRFITRLRQKTAEGERLGETTAASMTPARCQPYYAVATHR